MIRKATLGDLPHLTALVCNHLADDSTDIKDHVSSEFRACIGHKERTVYVAMDDRDECLGYILVHWIPFPLIKGHEGYISDLVVEEKHRGRGLGSDLMSAVEAEARQRRCCRLMLNNPKKAESYKRAFYKKRGFEEREHFSNFVKML